MHPVKGVNKVRAKGRVYYYHRATGTRLQQMPGTAEFIREIAALDSAGVAQARSLPGSLGAMIAAYRGSPEFLGLADLTKRDYNKVFDYLAGIADMPATEVDSPFVVALRDRVFRLRKRRFANYVVAVLRLLFKWGKPRGWPKVNPAADVPMIRRPRDAKKVNRAWSTDEKETVLREAERRIPHLLPGIALGVFTGISEGDMVRLIWPAYDGTAIRFTRRKTGVPVAVKALPALKAILNAERARQESHEAELARKAGDQVGNVVALRKAEDDTVLRGKRGKPYTEDGFRSDFFKFIRALESEGLVADGLTFHGLRHTLGKEMREARVSREGRKAVLGHETDAMSDHYSDEADRSIEAFDAMDLLAKAQRAKKRK
ncbi:tyrosine-type recombinase/integrase [Ferrovibrio xuzhouensis]|uniref:Tyrosine-type recombinase/integrase n=1 Tax=Ferrovibrio xuzhouensis TaxID=1576914 RepID=A0ABV7VB81_9PROT